MLRTTLIYAAVAVGLASGTAWAETARVLLQSTTSTANSGLYADLLPQFEAQTGTRVDVVAVGTGQALRNAQNCDGDVVLVHARDREEAFVADGYGVARFDVMYNDFVLVGPASDPAGIDGVQDPAVALARIAQTQARFASRGDASGTHAKERQLWQEAGQSPDAGSGTWYLETGSGMGATLNTAVGLDAYTLTDRATWLSFGNKGAHRIVVEGHAALFNQYGVIAVNPEACPTVNSVGAQALIDWLLSERGQDAIAAFRIGGTQVFFPNASDPGS